jgi:hypothetical protein
MMEIGIEAEFAALFAVAALGSSFFDKFETETPAARKLARWVLAAALTLGAYAWIGHWALAVLLGFALIGTVTHLIWCRMNAIQPLKAEPRRRYYELRGWKWPNE